MDLTKVAMQFAANDSDEPDLYVDDEKHPIPFLGVIDASVRLKSGGVYNGIALPSALAADFRSQKRLIRKIDNYISDLVAHRSERTSGVEAEGSSDMRIYVSLNPDSAPEIFSLLEKCRSWIESNHIELFVESDPEMFRKAFEDK